MKEKFIQLLKVADKDVRNRMLDAVDENVLIHLLVSNKDEELAGILVDALSGKHHKWIVGCNAYIVETDENGKHSIKGFVFNGEQWVADEIYERLKSLKDGTHVHSWHGMYMWEDEGWHCLFASPCCEIV